MADSSRLILHITTRAEWQAAQGAGTYRASSLAAEGFIHFSYPGQVVRTANAFYRGQRDLVLLCVDTALLDADLRVEHPVAEDTAERFPHLYGSLNLEAVLDVVPFPPTPDGSFTLPDNLPEP